VKKLAWITASCLIWLTKRSIKAVAWLQGVAFRLQKFALAVEVKDSDCVCSACGKLLDFDNSHDSHPSVCCTCFGH
jgi:hypothetical protein